MARRLNIGLYQGPPTLIAQTGKYGILKPIATLARSTPGTPTGQRFAGGFAAAMPGTTGQFAVGTDSGNFSIAAGPGSTSTTTLTGNYSAGGVPGGHTGNIGGYTLNSTGPSFSKSGQVRVTAYLTRFTWASFEPTQGAYSFTRMDAELAQCNALGMMYYPCLITKDYNGAKNFNAFPSWIQSFCVKFQNSSTDPTGGGMLQRWDTTTVQPALALAYKAIGQRYNANPYFGGIMTQETSLGTPVSPATSFPNYSGAIYLTALKSEVTAAAQYIPNARVLMFQNFMNDINNNAGDFKIDQYVQWAQQYGVILCGPDEVLSNASYTDAPGLYGRDYVRFDPYVNGGTIHRTANGAFAGGSTTFVASGNPTGISIQHSEWTDGGPGGPTSGAGAPYFMSDNYAYANGSGATKAPASNVFWYQPNPFDCDLLIFDFPGGAGGNPNGTFAPNSRGESFKTLVQAGGIINSTAVPFGPFVP